MESGTEKMLDKTEQSPQLVEGEMRTCFPSSEKSKAKNKVLAQCKCGIFLVHLDSKRTRSEIKQAGNGVMNSEKSKTIEKPCGARALSNEVERYHVINEIAQGCANINVSPDER